MNFSLSSFWMNEVCVLIHSFLFISFFFSTLTTHAHARMPARIRRCKRKQLFDVTKNCVQEKKVHPRKSVSNMLYELTNGDKVRKKDLKFSAFFWSWNFIKVLQFSSPGNVHTAQLLLTHFRNNWFWPVRPECIQSERKTEKWKKNGWKKAIKRDSVVWIFLVRVYGNQVFTILVNCASNLNIDDTWFIALKIKNYICTRNRTYKP